MQILLPLHDEAGAPYPEAPYLRVRQELTRVFGSLTAYSRAPADLPYDQGTGRPSPDDLVVYEVMAERLESGWWHAYRSELERRFHQPHIIVRAQVVEVL